MRKFIAYYHEVVADRRGAERYGLDAQRSTVAGWVERVRERVIASYTEIKTAKRSDQPELRKALAHARRTRATLLIARIETLLRNCAFFDALYEWEGVQFMALDFPFVSRDTLHVFSIVAKNENRQKSERIREALASHRARGGKLGNPANLDPESARRGRALGSRRVAEMARRDYEGLLPLLRSLQADGLSLREIAEHLNREGMTTRRGFCWNHNQVKRALDMYLK